MPLDQKLAENQIIDFDAETFVEGIWNTELMKVYNNAPDIDLLIDSLKQHPKSTFAKNGNSLGIGNIGYFRVKGQGEVLQINENNVLLQTANNTVEIETEFIFGNAIRDASGLIKINDFDDTSDFNSISEMINDRIRKELIPSFSSELKIHQTVRFEGAVELNREHLTLSQLEVIPFTLKIIP
ncbi:hypothetical protein GCM10007049_15830 [Echinicola pacifica]|uniref:DUF2291 domain-containing protein n=2 Tax=Echinicola pacifica TaxID=346377 RepID=A0A918UNX6_9BACT|nr:hypothetical protein GCM10007049_15830 [Echinicola pacifica]